MRRTFFPMTSSKPSACSLYAGTAIMPAAARNALAAAFTRVERAA
jgi:hypothetical protein